MFLLLIACATEATTEVPKAAVVPCVVPNPIRGANVFLYQLEPILGEQCAQQPFVIAFRAEVGHVDVICPERTCELSLDTYFETWLQFGDITSSQNAFTLLREHVPAACWPTFSLAFGPERHADLNCHDLHKDDLLVFPKSQFTLVYKPGT